MTERMRFVQLLTAVSSPAHSCQQACRQLSAALPTAANSHTKGYFGVIT